MVIKAWFFDAEGKSIKEEFETVEQAEQFAKDHGLELFKTVEMHRMVYGKL